VNPAGQGTPGAPAPSRAESSLRPKFTSRAAVLAIVICAIALSLAYPIREYIAERRQIDQLHALNSQLAAQVGRLKAKQRAYTSPSFIEQEARDQLHMCFPAQTCYVVINPSRPRGKATHGQAATPWYAVLWKSVREAGKYQGK
jgi:cell division protein FtsL